MGCGTSTLPCPVADTWPAADLCVCWLVVSVGWGLHTVRYLKHHTEPSRMREHLVVGRSPGFAPGCVVFFPHQVRCVVRRVGVVVGCWLRTG